MITDSITRLLQRLNTLTEMFIKANNANLNAIEADVESSNTAQATTNTLLETNNTLLTTNNNRLGTIETDIELTNTRLTTNNNSLTTIINNVTSKLERIKGTANYSRTYTYVDVTENIASIVHTGTTLLGVETVTETITYIDAPTDFRISTITYS